MASSMIELILTLIGAAGNALVDGLFRALPVLIAAILMAVFVIGIGMLLKFTLERRQNDED